MSFFTQAWVRGLLSFSMVIGPTIGFALQYFEIQKTGTVRGFSIWVCFLLLMANILRVFYWLVARFDTTLLLQSIAMLVTQLALLEVCTRLTARASGGSSAATRHETRRLFDGWSYFWRWTYFGEYVQFLLAVTLCVGFITYIATVSFQWSLYPSALGSLSVAFEAVFAVPQVFKLYMQKSGVGLRWELVATWILGDALKTAYYVYAGVPIQFLVCGLFQMGVDTTVGLQLIYYRIRRNRITLRNDPMTEL